MLALGIIGTTLAGRYPSRERLGPFINPPSFHAQEQSRASSQASSPGEEEHTAVKLECEAIRSMSCLVDLHVDELKASDAAGAAARAATVCYSYSYLYCYYCYYHHEDDDYDDDESCNKLLQAPVLEAVRLLLLWW